MASVQVRVQLGNPCSARLLHAFTVREGESWVDETLIQDCIAAAHRVWGDRVVVHVMMGDSTQNKSVQCGFESRRGHFPPPCRFTRSTPARPR